MIHVNVDIQQGIDAMRDAQVAVTDLSEFFRGPAENIMAEWFQGVFASEGTANGGRWASLSPLTQKLRRGAGRGRGGIGWDSGDLYASLAKRNGPNAYSVITPTSMIRGTNVNRSGYPYPTRFHLGGPVTQVFGRPLKSARTQPPRPLVTDPMPQAFVDRIQQGLDRWLAWKLNGGTI